MKKRILYAEANYAAMVRKNGYFVDKTEYIAKLEDVENPVFLRPRRFGKSLLCTTLEHYYSVRLKDQFDELFGHTWIGKNPTPDINGNISSILEVSRNVTERVNAEKQRENLISELKSALKRVKTLSGLLPICCHCKKIRDDSGYWNQVESYIANHSEATFSHGICQECAKKHYSDYDLYDDEQD